MIGNDVIDLNLAAIQSNWQRKGFMDRIFTASEHQFIFSSTNPETMVWLLWSMKESAYKIYNRTTAIRGFFPHRLVCDNIAANGAGFTGEVNIDGFAYYCRTSLLENQLHTVAVLQESDFKKVFSVQDVEVQKDVSGLPFINVDGINVPVSKSHHGVFLKIVAIRK